MPRASKGEIVRTRQSPQTEMVISPEARKLLEFEDVVALTGFFESIGWTPTQELQMLMDIIQNTLSETVKLRALKMLQERRTDIIKNSGLVIRATKTQKDEQGNRTIFSGGMIASAFGLPKPERKNNANNITNITNIQNTNTRKQSQLVPEHGEEGSDTSGDVSDATLHKPPVTAALRAPRARAPVPTGDGAGDGSEDGGGPGEGKTAGGGTPAAGEGHTGTREAGTGRERLPGTTEETGIGEEDRGTGGPEEGDSVHQD